MNWIHGRHWSESRIAFDSTLLMQQKCARWSYIARAWFGTTRLIATKVSLQQRTVVVVICPEGIWIESSSVFFFLFFFFATIFCILIWINFIVTIAFYLIPLVSYISERSMLTAVGMVAVTAMLTQKGMAAVMLKQKYRSCHGHCFN